MIDIHHHCIPDVDDGPRSVAEAADLCRMAADDGITTIVATPHVLRGQWQNRSRALLEQRLSVLREELGDSPRLLLGSEYFFDYDMTEVLRARSGIVPLADSRYFLVEFEANSIAPMVVGPFYEAQLEGWVPIIAHPERNSVLQSKPELLELLVRRGAKTQVTAASVTGEFGVAAQRAALRWIERGLVHFVSSDAHDGVKRPPRMRKAVEVLRNVIVDEAVDALVEHNARAVIENRQLAWDPDPEGPPRPRGVFGRLRSLVARR